MYYLDQSCLSAYIEAGRLPCPQAPFALAIEGIDSSGKTVQSTLLQQALRNRGLRTLMISFPNYQSYYGKKLGAMLTGKQAVRADALDAYSTALWFAMDRHTTLRGLKFDDIDVILFNRYVLSNAAYQSSRVPKSAWQDFFEFVLRTEYVELGLPVCDLTLVLDLPSDIAQKNMELKGAREYTDQKRDIYEDNKSLLNRVSQAYASLSRKLPAIEMIPCVKSGRQLPVEDVHQNICSVIDKLMEPNPV